MCNAARSPQGTMALPISTISTISAISTLSTIFNQLPLLINVVLHSHF
jgi:hypothetical protein